MVGRLAAPSAKCRGLRSLAAMENTRVTTVEQLRGMYREPSEMVRAKVQSSLDPVSIQFIERATFLTIATLGADGRVDVSPRGGPSGFVRVLDDGSIAIPDLNGNNLIDTLRAVVETGRVGMMFVHPGRDETLRVNGDAHVSVDPDVLAGFTAELRTPKCAIVVRPNEVFIHCAKAFRRGGVWKPETWPSFHDAPDAVDIISCQLRLGDDETSLRSSLERGYERELSED
jgi:uncharacterized protein